MMDSLYRHDLSRDLTPDQKKMVQKQMERLERARARGTRKPLAYRNGPWRALWIGNAGLGLSSMAGFAVHPVLGLGMLAASAAVGNVATATKTETDYFVDMGRFIHLGNVGRFPIKNTRPLCWPTVLLKSGDVWVEAVYAVYRVGGVVDVQYWEGGKRDGFGVPFVRLRESVDAGGHWTTVYEPMPGTNEPGPMLGDTIVVNQRFASSLYTPDVPDTILKEVLSIQDEKKYVLPESPWYIAWAAPTEQHGIYQQPRVPFSEMQLAYYKHVADVALGENYELKLQLLSLLSATQKVAARRVD